MMGNSIAGGCKGVDAVQGSWGSGLFCRPQEDNIGGREQNSNESQRPWGRKCRQPLQSLGNQSAK